VTRAKDLASILWLPRSDVAVSWGVRQEFPKQGVTKRGRLKTPQRFGTGEQTMKSNIHKKATFEDKFDRKFACWVKNSPKAWRFWKKRNCRLFRRKNKKGANDEQAD
jgi:hypothetical protein